VNFAIIYFDVNGLREKYQILK